jgi:hypothetical protein
MQTQVRPPRQRSSGGRTLMLLGLVLALAAAAIVFYITSSVQGTLSQTVSVVAARTDLKAGTILTLNNAVAPSVRIQDAFAVKQIDKNLAPPNAFVFANQDALNTALNNQVVKEDFLAGDVLRNDDPRLAPVGTTSGTSLTNINPPELKDGQVLYILGVNNADIGVQPGDTINIIITGGEVGGGSVSQTTLTNIPVYAVDVPAKGKIIVVVSNQDAVYLANMEHGGFTLTIVIRKPGDTTQPTTQPVDTNAISTRWFGKG